MTLYSDIVFIEHICLTVSLSTLCETDRVTKTSVSYSSGAYGDHRNTSVLLFKHICRAEKEL